MELYKINNFISKEDANILIEFIEKKMELHIDNAPRGRRILKFGDKEDNKNLISTLPIEFLEYVSDIVFRYWRDMTKLINETYKLDQEIYPSNLWLSKQWPGSIIPEHIDEDNEKNAKYSHTSVIYLNDQLRGGKTYFNKINEVIIPKQGNAIFFDCKDPDSFHGVTNTRETRYSISLWFTKNPLHKFEIF